MEGRIFKTNLAILDPMAKMVYHFGMQIGIYGQVAPTVKIKDPTIKIQAYPNKNKVK